MAVDDEERYKQCDKLPVACPECGHEGLYTGVRNPMTDRLCMSRGSHVCVLRCRRSYAATLMGR